MREIKRTDNGLIDGLLNAFEKGSGKAESKVQLGPSTRQKNIVGDNTADFPNLVGNDITLSKLFGKK